MRWRLRLKAYLPGIAVGVWLALSVAILVSRVVRAQSKTPWAMKDCFTLGCVTDCLNSLPPDRAGEAKVLAINSQRSMLGALSNPYYIWYRP